MCCVLNAISVRRMVESKPQPSGTEKYSYPSSSASSAALRTTSLRVSIGVSATPRRRFGNGPYPPVPVSESGLAPGGYYDLREFRDQDLGRWRGKTSPFKLLAEFLGGKGGSISPLRDVGEKPGGRLPRS